ncbi:MAG TPA: hypothetical protein VIJ38_06795 [Acidobacteriaceae bacterium]
MGRGKRVGYLTDVSDEEWALVLPYLLLSREAARFRRLARYYERLDSTLKGFHYVAFAAIMPSGIFSLLNPTS